MTEDDEQYESREAFKARRRGDYSINPEAEELAAAARLSTRLKAQAAPEPRPKREQPRYDFGIAPW